MALAVWKARLWRRRRWVFALGLVVVVRVSLPAILRPILVSQAEKLLKAQVELGDVDLHLLGGGVVLKDFAIRVREPSAAPPVGAPQPSGAGEAPIIAWKSLAIDVHWLPLFRRTVEFGSIILDSPRIALDRLESGEVNAEPLIRALTSPSGEARTTPDVPPASPSPLATAPPAPGWRLGVDHVELRDGRLRFRDLLLKGSEPLDVTIPTVTVEKVALDPELYEKPGDFHLHATLDHGSLDLDARLRYSADGLALESGVQAHGLPLGRTRLYIPRVGWSDLAGELDTDLSYRLETGKTHQVRGLITLRDVTVKVPDFPDAALSWKSLAIRIAPLDLVEHVVAVADVDLAGAWVVVRPQGGERLLALGSAAKASAAPDGQASAPSSPATETRPWQWSVARLRISDSRVHLLGTDAPLDVGVTASAADLAGTSQTPGKLDVDLGIGSGTVHVGGAVRVAPPGFSGALKVSALSIPEMISVSGAVAQSPLQSATLDADLSIDAGLGDRSASPGAAPEDLRVEGGCTVGGARVVQGDTTATADKIDLQISELALPGALAPIAASGAGGSPAAHQGDLRFRGALSLANPAVVLTRDAPPAIAARSLGVTVSELSLAGVLGSASEEASAHRGDVHFSGAVAAAEPKVNLPQLGDLHAAARSVDLSDTDVSAAAALPGSAGDAVGGARADAGDVRFAGNLSLADAKVVLADGKDFLVTLDSMRAKIADSGFPGVLAARPSAPPQPAQLTLRDLQLDVPVVRLVRTRDGLVVRGAARAPGAEVKKPVQPAAPESGPAAGVAIRLDAVHVRKGRFGLVDRTLSPSLSTELSSVQLEARDVRAPELGVKQMRLTVSTPDEGAIELSGDLAPQNGTLRLETHDVALMPYSPYVAALLPYRIASGSLRLSSVIKNDGGRYDLGNQITLEDLGLEGSEGESLLEEQFGIPLTTALALLRDTHGNISLDVPLQYSSAGTTIDIWTVAGGALRGALIGALTSPLRLVGSVVGGGAKVGSFAPAPIAYQVGRSELATDGAQAQERVGGLLASRPGMGVQLRAVVTAADQRWLREQALRQQWGQQGVLGRLGTLLQRSTRDRVEAALRARAEGGAGALAAEDTQALDRWLEAVPQPSPEQMRGLAASRLDKVAGALREGKGIDASRLVLIDPTADLAEGAPEVKIRLGPVKTLVPRRPRTAAEKPRAAVQCGGGVRLCRGPLTRRTTGQLPATPAAGCPSTVAVSTRGNGRWGDSGRSKSNAKTSPPLTMGCALARAILIMPGTRALY